MRATGYARELTINGMFVAWSEQRRQPILICIGGHPYLPVYSTVAKLKASMAEAQVDEDFEIKEITNGEDFLRCLAAQDVPVCLDPHLVGRKTRFYVLRIQEDS